MPKKSYSRSPATCTVCGKAFEATSRNKTLTCSASCLKTLALADVEAGQDRVLDLRRIVSIDPRREGLPEQRLPQRGAATERGV